LFDWFNFSSGFIVIAAGFSLQFHPQQIFCKNPGSGAEKTGKIIFWHYLKR